MALLVCLGATLTAPLLRAPAATGAGTEGQILGRVLDRTAPAHPLGKQVVRLTVIEPAATAEHQTTTDAQGGFAFTTLPIGGIRVFVLATEYEGVRYESEQIALRPEAPVQSRDLVVYERAPTRARVQSTVAFAVVDIARGGIRVNVIRRFENPTDRAAVPTADDPLEFPLPPGAEGVTFLAGWRAPRLAGGRITDTFPLVPGTVQVVYAFVVETRTPDLTLPWALPDGAADVEVLVQDTGVRARGEGLRPAGMVTGPRGRYLRLTGGPVAPGGRIAVHLEGLPTPRQLLPAVVAAVLAVVLGGGLIWALRRPRTAST